MRAEDILKLIDAGFTKADIIGLFSAAEPAADPAPKEPPAPPEPAPAPAPADNSAAVLAAIDGLTKAIQASNILNSNTRVNEETTDDILAEIINPQAKRGKK